MKKLFVLLFIIYSFTGCREEKFEGHSNSEPERWTFKINYPNTITFKYALKDIETRIGKDDPFIYGDVFFELPDGNRVKAGSAIIINDTLDGIITSSEMKRIMTLTNYDLDEKDFFTDARYILEIRSLDSFADELYSERFWSFYINEIK